MIIVLGGGSGKQYIDALVISNWVVDNITSEQNFCACVCMQAGINQKTSSGSSRNSRSYIGCSVLKKQLPKRRNTRRKGTCKRWYILQERESFQKKIEISLPGWKKAEANASSLVSACVSRSNFDLIQIWNYSATRHSQWRDAVSTMIDVTTEVRAIRARNVDYYSCSHVKYV